MNWTELVNCLAAQEHTSDGQAVFGTNPAVAICRSSKRAKGFAAPGGELAYDPSGTVLLSATRTNTGVLYENEPFLTQAVCWITLPQFIC